VLFADETAVTGAATTSTVLFGSTELPFLYEMVAALRWRHCRGIQ
jgi:hypothetical protein